MRSDKPEALAFQDWVTREVLPAIRKDGVYVAAHFGKRHDHVFRDIRTLIPRVGERVLATELTLHTLDSEPRVLDTDLAERLGMAAPRKVRDIIRSNEAELLSYGTLGALASKSRGQEFTAYYLNEEQALLICMFSKTANAALVHEPTPSDILRESEKRPPATHPSAAP